MSDLFALQIAKFVEKAKANTGAVVRKVVLDAGSTIVLRTPVDSGRARANWQYDQGSVTATTTDAVDPDGSAAIAAINAGVQRAPVETIHYVVNSLPYISTLEYGLYPDPPKNPSGKTVGGFSKQAPAGMVGLTVVEYQQFVDRAVASLQE